MTAATVELPVMLSPEQLCEWVPGLTVRGLQELRSARKGPPFVKVNRTTIVYPADLALEWMREHVSVRRRSA